MSSLLRGRVRRTMLPGDQLPVTVGGPTVSAWREDALSRIADVESLQRQFAAERPPREFDEDGVEVPDPEFARFRELDDAVTCHLRAARETAEKMAMGPLRRCYAALTGGEVERTLANLHAAAVHLLRMTPADTLRGALPSLLVQVRGRLPASDLRRQEVEKLAADPGYSFDRHNREQLAYALEAAYTEERAALSRMRSFRNLVYMVTCTLLAVLGGLVAVGAAFPRALPLCFAPGNERIVCPTGWHDLSGPSDIDRMVSLTVHRGDLAIVAMMGLVGAVMVGVLTLRAQRGTVAPYSLPLALLILKLPLGGLTALLGVLMVRGGFVPGLTNLDGSSQILGWALVFGIAQQLISGVLDRQASLVLADSTAALGDGAP